MATVCQCIVGYKKDQAVVCGDRYLQVCAKCYSDLLARYESLLAEKNAMVRECHEFRELNRQLVDRVATQSEILTRRAKKQKNPGSA